MKTYIAIASLLISTMVFSADELAWVDTQVEAIKPPRKGMSRSEFSKVRDPFIFLKKNKTASKKTASSSKKVAPKRVVPGKLTAQKLNSSKTNSVQKKKVIYRGLHLTIIMNKSALINGKWYKLNDKVFNYKITSINTTSVTLTSGTTKRILTTNASTKNLKFK